MGTLANIPFECTNDYKGPRLSTLNSEDCKKYIIKKIDPQLLKEALAAYANSDQKRMEELKKEEEKYCGPGSRRKLVNGSTICVSTRSPTKKRDCNIRH